jgi:hypothetical protein
MRRAESDMETTLSFHQRWALANARLSDRY